MSIYQHFRPEEKEFIDQVLGWKLEVENRYAPKLTDFLDPREQFIVQSIIGSQSDSFVQFFGGTSEVERKRALLYPDYFEPMEEDFQITLFEIDYPEKFVTLKHPQVLGSLMGLGLKREKFGDIIIQDKRIQFFVAQEIAEYVRLELRSIGKSTVVLSEKPLSEAMKHFIVFDDLVVTVASLRLDTVLAQVARLSRQKAKLLIEQGSVKVNWTVIDSPAYELREGDIISAKRIGRMKLKEIGDQTKKDKWRIIVGLYK